MTTGKIIALTTTFVGKVMSLLFNMLSRLVIAFLPRSKRLLISWLQSPSAVILEPPKIKSTVMPSSHLILCRPFSSCPQSFPASGSFPMSQLCMRWPKYLSFSFSISPSNEHPGLISFRTDWLDLLAVQGTLKSLLQHHSSKASLLQPSVFFTIQLSHPYMTTGKITPLKHRLISKTMLTKRSFTHTHTHTHRVAWHTVRLYLKFSKESNKGLSLVGRVD